ncbi:hypothetical protein MesoLj113c_46090 [Mesorhizobium sp. 113-3-9]|uniref:hypothetical protein n=1 Tax=Mesorhizobium sp. 113-3-9 TaxID=2744517 RepID=UPI001928C473|nr:hypothetical protein [Mesorhizobium sp. 113-3-9]BCG88499.1 hypothetical protein MesoLj113c_46090 [Mesorhizobium sp. 113-3-9]
MVKGLILVGLIALAGCTSPKGSFCAISEPVRLSETAIAAMSDTEVKAALTHNRTGQKLCGWKP